jgi:hypothetical protein
MNALLFSFFFLISLTGVSSAAEQFSTIGEQGGSQFTLELDPEDMPRVLGEVLERGMAYLRDHVEIKKRRYDGGTGKDTRGELEVKIYPEGKEHPDSAVGGKGAYEYSGEGNLHLRFDINLSPERRQLDDYL